MKVSIKPNPGTKQVIIQLNDKRFTPGEIPHLCIKAFSQPFAEYAGAGFVNPEICGLFNLCMLKCLIK